MSPYLRKVVALYAAGALRGGRLTEIEVQHDNDCPRLRAGPCRCDPWLVIRGRRVEVSTA